MPRKRTVKSRKSPKRSSQIPAFFIFRRIIVIPLVLVFVGFLALSQTAMWQDFVSGKEKFSPYNPSETVGRFEGKTFQVPTLLTVDTKANNENVLGDTSNKRIEVDLANQRVYTFEGGAKVHDFVVSTGLNDWTPRGEFTIQRRVAAQTMSGPGYYLPGVQFVQYIGNNKISPGRGFSFHSTYWHNDFGKPKSHGCINMKTEDSAILWNWAGIGTRVVIYGVPPRG